MLGCMAVELIVARIEERATAELMADLIADLMIMERVKELMAALRDSTMGGTTVWRCCC